MMKLDENNYSDMAEQAIKELSVKKDNKGKPIPIVTTSKIRNLLAMTTDIYNDVMEIRGEKLSGDIIGRINYLKIRFVYEAGRDDSVKNLVMAAKIREHLEEIKDSKKQFILFSRYMEALVAYRKFYGGRDE